MSQFGNNDCLRDRLWGKLLPKSVNPTMASSSPEEHATSSIGARIIECARKFHTLNENRTLFSAAAGITSSCYSKYIAGYRIPSLKTAAAIADTANVNLKWLATGTGPRDRVSMDKLLEFERGQFEPIFDLSTAGPQDEPSHLWGCMRTDTLRDCAPTGSRARWGMFQVQERLDHSKYDFNDYVLVDLSQLEPAAGDWCLRLAQGQLVVREATLSENGSIELLWPVGSRGTDVRRYSREELRTIFKIVGVVVGKVGRGGLRRP